MSFSSNTVSPSLTMISRCYFNIIADPTYNYMPITFSSFRKPLCLLTQHLQSFSRSLFPTYFWERISMCLNYGTAYLPITLIYTYTQGGKRGAAGHTHVGLFFLSPSLFLFTISLSQAGAQGTSLKLQQEGHLFTRPLKT